MTGVGEQPGLERGMAMASSDRRRCSHSKVACCNGPHGRGARDQDHVRCERNQFLGIARPQR
jgi:hypothetical protein